MCSHHNLHTPHATLFLVTSLCRLGSLLFGLQSRAHVHHFPLRGQGVTETDIT